MRHATACRQCRVNKRKCIPIHRLQRCHQCNRKGIECSFQLYLNHTPSPRETGTSQSPQNESDVGRDTDVVSLYGAEFVVEMIRTYLYWIHDRPHSLFHVNTLWRDFASRSLPDALLLCLCAMGCRLSPKEEVREMSTELTLSARQAVKSQVENVSIHTVQSCILLANLCAAELEPSLEVLYFGIANRMAHLLRLHQPSASDDPILRETKCRVWWTLVMADNWCSAGLGIPRQLHEQGKQVQLPTSESHFQSLPSPSPPSPSFPPPPGLWAHMIELVNIFGPITDLHHDLLATNPPEPEITSSVHDLSLRLERWHRTLPSHLRLTPENLEAHRALSLGGPFVALHLGFFHYSTLLYFRYLDHSPRSGAEGPGPRHEEYARRCRLFAAEYSRLLETSRGGSGMEVVYVTVGHMTVVSSSVLLHALLFGAGADVAGARERLTANFAALIELRRFWPCLEQTMRRLLDFQNSCLRTGGRDMHRVDEWMVRFLTEHSLPLDKRIDPLRSLRGSPRGREGVEEESEREAMATRALAHLWEMPEEG